MFRLPRIRLTYAEVNAAKCKQHFTTESGKRQVSPASAPWYNKKSVSTPTEYTTGFATQMSLLSAHNLSKSYGAQDVFQGVSLEVARGAKIGLVGPNGMGKSTLLRLLVGVETPSAGAIHKARDARIGYLPQKADFAVGCSLWEAMLEVFADVRMQRAELRRLESAIAHSAEQGKILERYGQALEAFELAGGYTYEHRIKRILSGLGFGESAFGRQITQFSGGERTRGLLVKLLLESPTILLLDEPTNYLDLDAIEWLEDYLKAWGGPLIVVSHDRAFLDAVVTETWELAWGQLAQYRGNYTAYVKQRAERVLRQQGEYKRQQAQVAKTEDFIRRNMAGQLSRQAKGRQKRLARVQLLEQPRAYRPLDLELGKVARSGDMVLRLSDLAIGYSEDSTLCEVPELEIRRGERVGLLGPNGAGKTTLVRTILDEIPALTGQVQLGANVKLGYFAQGQTTLDLEQTVLETVLSASDLRVSEARGFLGSYGFSGDDVFKCVGNLSGGEQARVAMALLTLQGANLLLLDEPTNQLDIPSQEVLQDVLKHYQGTLLLVTHDRYLVKELATVIWAMDGPRIREFREGYREYLAWEQERVEKRSGSDIADKSVQDRAREVRRAAQRRAARQTRQQAEIEEKISQLEERLVEIEARIASASERQAVGQVAQLGVEHNQIKAALDEALSAWTDIEQ